MSSTNPYASTAPMICASVFSADFAKLGAEIKEVSAGDDRHPRLIGEPLATLYF